LEFPCDLFGRVAIVKAPGPDLTANGLVIDSSRFLWFSNTIFRHKPVKDGPDPRFARVAGDGPPRISGLGNAFFDLQAVVGQHLGRGLLGGGLTPLFLLNPLAGRQCFGLFFHSGGGGFELGQGLLVDLLQVIDASLHVLHISLGYL